MVGTVQYMSPEQAAARNHELTPATDIYALGAILYSVLTGRPPFEKRPSVLEMIGRVVGGKFPPPRAVKPVGVAGAGSGLLEGDVAGAGGALRVGEGPGGRRGPLARPTSR